LLSSGERGEKKAFGLNPFETLRGKRRVETLTNSIYYLPSSELFAKA